jgi:hypothetical protein
MSKPGAAPGVAHGGSLAKLTSPHIGPVTFAGGVDLHNAGVTDPKALVASLRGDPIAGRYKWSIETPPLDPNSLVMHPERRIETTAHVADPTKCALWTEISILPADRGFPDPVRSLIWHVLRCVLWFVACVCVCVCAFV